MGRLAQNRRVVRREGGGDPGERDRGIVSDSQSERVEATAYRGRVPESGRVEERQRGNGRLLGSLGEVRGEPGMCGRGGKVPGCGRHPAAVAFDPRAKEPLLDVDQVTDASQADPGGFWIAQQRVGPPPAQRGRQG